MKSTTRNRQTDTTNPRIENGGQGVKSPIFYTTSKKRVQNGPIFPANERERGRETVAVCPGKGGVACKRKRKRRNDLYYLRSKSASTLNRMFISTFVTQRNVYDRCFPTPAYISTFRYHAFSTTMIERFSCFNTCISVCRCVVFLSSSLPVSIH